MAGTVARLYRYPVKGMSAEPRDRLRVLPTGAPEGDRVLGFVRRSALDHPDRVDPTGAWWSKDRFAALVNTPGLARLAATYETGAHRLAVRLGDGALAEGDVTVGADRARLSAVVTRFVAALPDSALAPDDALELVGDGVTSRFHDRGPRHVTLMASSSVAALADALGAYVDERRFRMNVVIDGVQPWEELEWVGCAVRVGGIEFDVTGPVVRCLATHANPGTGERDLDVLTALTRRIGQDRPTMGVLAVPRGHDGHIAELVVGDAVTVLP